MRNIEARPFWELPAIFAVIALALGFAIYGEGGCNKPQAVTAGVGAAGCIIEHALAGESVAQISLACLVPVEEVVVSLLNAPPQTNVVGTNAELESRRARLTIMGTALPALGCEPVLVDAGGATTGHGK